MSSTEELADFNRAVSHWSNQFAPELRKVAYVIGSRMGWDHGEFQISWGRLQAHYEKAHGETVSENTLKKYARLWADQGGLKIVAGWRETNGPQIKKADPARRGRDGKRVGTRGGRRMNTDASNTFAVDFNTVVKARRVSAGQRGRPVTEYYAEPWEFGTVPAGQNCLTPQLPLNSPSVTPYSSFDSSEDSPSNYPGAAGEVGRDSGGNSQDPGGQAPQTPQEPEDPGHDPWFTWYVWRAKSGTLAIRNPMDPGFDRRKIPASAIEFALSPEDGKRFYDAQADLSLTVEDRALWLLRKFGEDDELASVGVYRRDVDDPEYAAAHAAEVEAQRLRDEIESYREKYVAAESSRLSRETASKFFSLTIRNWRAEIDSSTFARGLTDAQILDRLPKLIEHIKAKNAA